MIVNLPHVGPWNIDRIVRVTAHGAKWRHGGDRPKARRMFIWWGKPYRDYDPWDYLRQASIRVWTGSGYDDYVEYYCKPGEPVRWRDEVLAAIAAARATGPERIVAAAIRRAEKCRDVEHAIRLMVYTLEPPFRHHHILHSMPVDPGTDSVLNVEQGFITSTGRWVDRKTAMGIAVASGQVSPSKVTAPNLFSEDLW